MEPAVRETIEACAAASHAGTRSFAEVVGALSDVGVEAYHADYRAARTTYYLPDGTSHTVPLPMPARARMPDRLSAEEVQAAIRGSQRGEVKYPEFLELSSDAGCVGYIVFLRGRQVTYFGRDGSQHIERFPGT